MCPVHRHLTSMAVYGCCTATSQTWEQAGRRRYGDCTPGKAVSHSRVKITRCPPSLPPPKVPQTSALIVTVGSSHAPCLDLAFLTPGTWLLRIFRIAHGHQFSFLPGFSVGGFHPMGSAHHTFQQRYACFKYTAFCQHWVVDYTPWSYTDWAPCGQGNCDPAEHCWEISSLYEVGQVQKSPGPNQERPVYMYKDIQMASCPTKAITVIEDFLKSLRTRYYITEASPLYIFSS